MNMGGFDHTCGAFEDEADTSSSAVRGPVGRGVCSVGVVALSAALLCGRASVLGFALEN